MMHATRCLSVAMLLAVTLWPGAAHSVGKVWPHYVKNLTPGPRTCTVNAPGIYQYSATWTPATWENKPWLGRHIVEAHNCTAGPVSCTVSLCTVKVTGCRTGKPGPWIAVKADVGVSGGVPKVPAGPPSNCL